MLIVTISYYDDIVMWIITIMITIGYHDDQLIMTIAQLYNIICFSRVCNIASMVYREMITLILDNTSPLIGGGDANVHTLI